MVKQNQQLLLNIMYGPLSVPRVIVYRIKNENVTTHWSLSTINKIIILYVLVTQSCIHIGAIILIESSIQW